MAAAFATCTAAQRIVSPLKSCITPGRRSRSASIGQKSAARRATSGRPTSTDPRNTSASTRVVAIGCMKYRNVLPLRRATNVRTIRPMVASRSTPGIRWPCRTRRSTLPKVQQSTAIIAAPAPNTFRNT